MDMQTKKDDETGLPVQNFAVFALQRKIFARSNIRMLFINKQSLNYEPGSDSTKAAIFFIQPEYRRRVQPGFC